MILLHPETNRRRLVGQLLWFLGWVVITGLAFYLKPDPAGHGTHTQLGLPPCPSMLFFGKPCPGCGMTTSFAHTVRFEIGPAFGANLFGPLTYWAYTISAWVALVAFVRGLRIDTVTRAFNWTLGTFLVVYVLFGAWRFFATPEAGVERFPAYLRERPTSIDR